MVNELVLYNPLKKEDLERLSKKEKLDTLIYELRVLNQEVRETTNNLKTSLDRIEAMEEKRAYDYSGGPNYMH